MSDPFIAEIRVFAFEFAPKGWAMCQGEELPTKQNPPLFSLLGSTFGGDGTTTFGLPDLQSSTVMGVGAAPGLSARALGQVGGQRSVTLTPAEMPAHSHPQGASQGDATSRSPADRRFAVNTGGVNLYGPPPSDPAQLVQLASESSPSVGGGEPHTNMQPYLPLNFCIALHGTYPARPTD